jgi:hypothetical protein
MERSRPSWTVAPRFALGAGLLLAASFAWARDVPDLRDLLQVSLALAGMTAGYLAALRALRPSLRVDAGVGGRRGTVAGLAAAGLFLTLVPFVTPHLPGVAAGTRLLIASAILVATAVAVGAAAAAALFFPWLLSRDERRAMREIDALDPRRELSAEVAAVPLVVPVAQRNRAPVA